MNVQLELKEGIREIGLALRRPEALALRWRDRTSVAAPSRILIPLLIANAALGLAAYGLTMHMHRGLGGMLEGAFLAPLAAGMAWSLALPALYILGSTFGSRLDFSTTLLAASLTVSFGSLAMLASVPITWFFSLALPHLVFWMAVNLLVFAGVGVCMSDVFLRVMHALEPERGQTFPCVWLGLLSVIGAELFWLLGVFRY